MHSKLTTNKKIYTIKSKLFSEHKFSLAYSSHSFIPRVKQSTKNGGIFLESRILNGLTLDYIADKLSSHWLKMFVNPAKWTVYIPSKNGLVLFVINTQKTVKPTKTYLNAKFITSYLTSNSIKISRKMREKSKTTIYLDDEICDAFVSREIPNKEKLKEYSKEIAKLNKKNRRVWIKKQRTLKQQQVSYNIKASKNRRHNKKWKHFEEKTFEEMFY